MNQWRNAMLVLFLFMSLVSNTKATTLVNKNGFRDQHPDIYNVRYNQARDVLIADLNKTYYGQNTLRLRRMLNMDGRYRGKRIKKVVLVGYSISHQTSARLLINRAQRGPVQRTSYNQDRIKFFLNYQNILGSDIRKLQVQLRGDFTLTKIKVKFSSNYGGTPSDRPWWQSNNLDYKRRNFNSQVYGKQVFNLSSFSNSQKVAKHVVLKVRNQSQSGERKVIKLKSNRELIAKKVLDQRYEQIVQFDLSNYSHLNPRDLKVILKGDMTLDWIEVGKDRWGVVNSNHSDNWDNNDWNDWNDWNSGNTQERYPREKVETFPLFLGFPNYGEIDVKQVVPGRILKSAKVLAVNVRSMNSRMVSTVELCIKYPQVRVYAPQNCQRRNLYVGQNLQRIEFMMPRNLKGKQLILRFVGHNRVDSIQVKYL